MKDFTEMLQEKSEAGPTFWLNVTTSFQWKRSPVGIVRTEQEIGRHLRNILGDRLQTIIFEERNFILEPATSSELASNFAEFWPEPSFGSSADLFDAVQAPPAIQASKSMPVLRKPAFRRGDILITVGLDWEYPGLHEEIRRIAKCYDLVVITCCYDLIPILYPQYCVSDVSSWFKKYLMDMTWVSDGILCISENTRQDYLNFSQNFGLPKRETKVIKLGSSLPPASTEEAISDEVGALLESRYFLFVSTIERRKNHEVLYRAVHLIRKENPDVPLPKLVFVGMQGWGVSELMSDIALDPLLDGDIVILPHVSDGELSRLYANCEAFLYPSLYEGWGLPIAEALQLGRPVLASRAGSIPEVGGDLVRYLDPWSPKAWAEEMLAIARSETDLAAWTRTIARDFLPYEWSSAAKTVIEMAQGLLASKPSALTIEPGYELSTIDGVHYGDKIIFTGEEGIACHGPYISLAQGCYHVKVGVTWIAGSSGHLRVAALHNAGTMELAAKRIDMRSLNLGAHDFTLRLDLAEDCHELEFVCEVHGFETVKFSIDKIVVERVVRAVEVSVPTAERKLHVTYAV